MMKHIRSLGSAAALAVSVTLVAGSAVAQAPPPLKTGPQAEQLAGARIYQGEEASMFRDGGRDDWRNDARGRDGYRGGRGRAPDFQRVQAQCSRAAIQEAWARNYYSAQYEGGPRLVDGRRGWEMHGRLRLHDERGYTFVRTICDIDGRGARIEFLR